MMRKKKLAILTICCVLFMACFQSGSVLADKGNGTVVDSGTKERLMEKYDLVEPEPANPAAHGSQYDFGISNPISLLVSISRLYLYPYVFAAQEIINHLIDQSEISN
ncbi:hypothetical protein MHH49_29100 [Paenibacillus sp. FSL F4-0122]|uniref:hypothetical protein n=2 Tax=Paenibacillus TaxID=44249 RepID=UPI00138E0172|nr:MULTISPECIES: hypothetical protein [Paenibacillus]